MKNEITAKRLSLALSNSNIKPQELADKSGVSKASISQYVNGSHAPSNISSGKMATVLKVNPLWLMGFDVPMVENTASEEERILPFSSRLNDINTIEFELITKYRNLDTYGKEIVDLALDKETERIKKFGRLGEESNKTIPFPKRLISYYFKNASAGTGQLVIDNLPDKDIEIPDTPEYKNVSYAIGVNGSSMEPAFHDGDILLVEATREIEVGDIGIFQIDNECYVKKLGKTELISLNKNYKNIALDDTAATLGKVIGKL